MIRYEWAVETVDEYGDALDVNHFDADQPKALEKALAEASSIKLVEVALVRDLIDDIDEDLKDRRYAYLENGILPPRFEGGAVVPNRFIIQANIAAAVSK